MITSANRESPGSARQRRPVPSRIRWQALITRVWPAWIELRGAKDVQPVHTSLDIRTFVIWGTDQTKQEFPF